MTKRMIAVTRSWLALVMSIGANCEVEIVGGVVSSYRYVHVKSHILSSLNKIMYDFCWTLWPGEATPLLP